MPQQIRVTQSELEILDVLWKYGPSTARQVLERLTRKKVAYSTVITLLQRMEMKDAVTSRKADVGKAFVFEAAVKPQQVRKQAVKSLLKDYFQNDPLNVFSTLVETKKLKAEEIEQMRAMLDELENEEK